jgi:hypothetical protein
MSIAWTTVVILLVLLPGIFFFIGMAFYERLSREVIRGSAVSEIALAIAVALALHLLALSVLTAFGFEFANFIEPLIGYDRLASSVLVQRVVERVLPAMGYFTVVAAAGFGVGWIMATFILRGPLRFLATHKWIYDIVDADRKKRVLTACVMTNTVENNNALMYKGRLHEFYLLGDGKISYLVIKNCSRYFMHFKDSDPETGVQYELFGHNSHQNQIFDYLVIEGSQIANVLFDATPEITGIKEGEAVLEEALEQLKSLGEDTSANTSSSSAISGA